MSKIPILIRKAKKGDLEDLYRIEIECFHEEAFPFSYMRRIMDDPKFITLVAVSSNRIVGFIITSLEEFEGDLIGHICSIDVKSEYRGRGIGSRLLSSAEKILKKMGAKICYLETYENNATAVKFYLKHGYKSFKTLRNYYGKGKNGIRFVKKLES